MSTYLCKCFEHLWKITLNTKYKSCKSWPWKSVWSATLLTTFRFVLSSIVWKKKTSVLHKSASIIWETHHKLPIFRTKKVPTEQFFAENVNMRLTRLQTKPRQEGGTLWCKVNLVHTCTTRSRCFSLSLSICWLLISPKFAYAAWINSTTSMEDWKRRRKFGEEWSVNVKQNSIQNISHLLVQSLTDPNSE